MKITPENLESLDTYLKENNLTLADIEINVKKECKGCAVSESVSVPLVEETDVALIFLSDNPKIKAKISDSNILYVDEVHSNENVCMPTKVNVLGRNILVNVCNEDGASYTYLNIALDNKPLYNVLFEIRKKGTNNLLLEIQRDIIEKLDDN